MNSPKRRRSIPRYAAPLFACGAIAIASSAEATPSAPSCTDFQPYIGTMLAKPGTVFNTSKLYRVDSANGTTRSGRVSDGRAQATLGTWVLLSQSPNTTGGGLATVQKKDHGTDDSTIRTLACAFTKQSNGSWFMENNVVGGTIAPSAPTGAAVSIPVPKKTNTQGDWVFLTVVYGEPSASGVTTAFYSQFQK